MHEDSESSQWLTRLIAIFDLGIAPGVVPPEEMRRIRIIGICTLSICVLGPPYVLQFWRLGLPEVALATALNVLAAAANLVLLRVRRNPLLAGHIAISILAAQLIISNIPTGGFWNPNFSWFYLLPLAAAVGIDLRGAAIWTGITMLICAGFAALPAFGIETPNQIPEELRQGFAVFSRLTAILAIGLIAGSFVTGQRHAERQLAAANEDLLRETAYNQLLMHAAVSSNEASSFAGAMQESVERICSAMGWIVGHILHVLENGQLVSSGIFLNGDDSRFVGLRELTANATYRAGEGLPGRALATGQPQGLSDLYASELGDRAKLAASAGLVSAFAIPVMVNGKVRAVLEFASIERLPHMDRLLAVFSHIGVQVGRVAERAELHERLRQSQKMEAVGQLAAGLAHEINNPMSYVRSNLHILIEDWDEVRSKLHAQGSELAISERIDDCRELIVESLEGVERTIAIVRDMRDFSHAGGLEQSEREPAELSNLLESALRVALTQAGGGIEIKKDWGELPDCLCAPNQLRQVFVNLIVNAIQAVGERGTIRLVTGRADDVVFARVEDDGPGISETIRDRLFDPFFTTKPVGEGTGLGLSVSYEIVRSHGGEIRVHSEPESGATFEVRLPIDPSTPLA